MSFKVGDKVQAIRGMFVSNAVGSVIKILSGNILGVAFNLNEVSPELHCHLHNLDGILQGDYGRWFYHNELTLVEEEIDEL